MNLWFLTEERPKIEVLEIILKLFCKNYEHSAFFDKMRIIPVIEKGQFIFTYEIMGFRCNKVRNIYIKTVSGYSSFFDFLIFYQNNEPIPSDKPIYLIEETKTDDKESRNTGVYQRCLKFVFAKHYYPDVKMVMLYNLKNIQTKKPTETSIFGTRLLLTLGVEILGKTLDSRLFKPFLSVDAIIDLKKKMRMPPKGNIPILINRVGKDITISGRLFKKNSLSHDPNMGALSIISRVLRLLGHKEKIKIIQHGLKQEHITSKNKFIKICYKDDLVLDGLLLPTVKYDVFNEKYWKYEKKGEKLATIFIHLAVENFTRGYSIFENHAGCERGYFLTSNGDYIQLEKYKNKEKYKAGNKAEKVEIPDLVLLDEDRKSVINGEGKTYSNLKQGISQLDMYVFFEKEYIKKYYEEFSIIRTLILYGGKSSVAPDNKKVGFLLNSFGDLILPKHSPELFKTAINEVKNFWK